MRMKSEDRILAAYLDDEQHCIDTLKWELERHCPEVSLIASWTDPEAMMEDIKSLDIDLLFLDIHLQSTNGIEFLKQISPVGFNVVFVTAFDNYAIQAFELNAQNYLLKPIVGHKLKTAIQYIRSESQPKLDATTFQQLKEDLKHDINKTKKIPFAMQTGIEFIDPQSITYVEGDNNYSKIYLEDKSKLMVSKTLRHIEDLVSDYAFLRIHKSYLINLAYIKSYHKNDGGYVQLIDGTTLRVSRAKRAVLNDLFK